MKGFFKWLIIILILIFLVTLYFEYNPQKKDNKNKNQDKTISQKVIEETYLIEDLADLELPEDDDIIKYKAFSLSYNEEYEQAEWVAYVLTCSETKGKIKRTDNFREDERIMNGSANDQDYKRSGYDRGHLMPAADNSWDLTAMKESFLYSNMSPQEPSFNRGIWKELEEQVRDWACTFDSIYVVTGPIFTNNMKRIGPNKVAVPPYYFKALLYYSSNKTEAIAFILPNEKSNKEIYQYVVTIDSLESKINFDLFYKLNDEFENTIESKYNLNFWFNQIN